MIDVVMPQMGESLTEGTVSHWLKAVGDRVEKDEAILEIETDKVNTEVEASAAGVLSEILVPEGETVPVGSLLGRISVDDSADLPAATPSGAHFGGQGDVQLLSFRRSSGADSAVAASAGSPAVGLPSVRVRFSPAVLELADRSGVSQALLETVPGTGANGRVSKRDLERWLEARGSDKTSDVAAVVAGGGGSGSEIPASFTYSPTPRDVRTRMSPTRKSIAEHMLWSQRISAQATVSDEMDVSALVAYVAREKENFRERVGAGLTFTSVIGFTIVQTLAEFPMLNCALVGDDIIQRPYVHLGVAVAIEEGRELIVPVIDDADQLSFDVFARRVEDVTVRARARRLERRELGGGTFTYSNPGMAGGTSGTPIINQPQVAILSTLAIRKRPWVVDDELAVRPVMGISATFDHRVVDGLMAYQFVTRFIELLSDPDTLVRSRNGSLDIQ